MDQQGNGKAAAPRRQDGGTLRPARNAINRHATRRPAAKRAVDNPHDWLIEDYWCTEALLDPAAGSGRILAVCRSRGMEATGSDLVDRGCGAVTPVDFTRAGAWPPDSFDNIITNPPYYGGEGAVAFIERALVVARRAVAALVNLAFLASQGRYPLWRRWPCSHLVILSRRSSMPPGALLMAGEVEPRGGKEDYVWAVFTRGHVGPPVALWGGMA